MIFLDDLIQGISISYLFLLVRLRRLELPRVLPTLPTLNGQNITVLQKDGKIWIQDAKGNYSEIIATDVMGSNGVIHVINTVIMPN